MHKLNKIYYFIDEFNRKEFENLNKNISIIYRNYQTKHNYKIIKEIKDAAQYAIDSPFPEEKELFTNVYL